MSTASLPEGFYWTPWTTGTVALKLDEHLIGLVVSGCANGRCRAERSVGTVHIRCEFFSHRDIAVRFLEAWARRWEAKIRQQYGSIGRPDYGPLRASDAKPMQTNHWRRARGPRIL